MSASTFRFTQDEHKALRLLLDDGVYLPDHAPDRPTAKPSALEQAGRPEREVEAAQKAFDAWNGWLRAEVSRWRQLLGSRGTGHFEAAVSAHLVSERGHRWPKTSDLSRHLPAAPSSTSRVGAQVLQFTGPVVSQAACDELADRVSSEGWFSDGTPSHLVLERVCREYRAAGQREGKVIVLRSHKTETQPSDTDLGPKVKAPAKLVDWLTRGAS